MQESFDSIDVNKINFLKKEQNMKRYLISAGISLALSLGALAPASLAKGKTKHSAAHNAAVKECNETYNSAVKEAKTKKGKERSAELSAAKSSRKQCIAAAPK